jgi:curli biogenesis system outer membrane secretion channel CsgG
MRISSALGVVATLGLAMATAASAESIREKTERKAADIPTCGRNLGTIAIREPEHNWWSDLHLSSPEVLLKVFVRKSGCFTLVDRGKGFEMAQQERALASGGQLQQGSNIGGGQVKAADYILVPDIASKNNNASGTNIGGILGGLVGGGAGAIISNISITSKTADVVLSIVNVRTSEDGPITEGHGSKTDVGFGVGGGWGNWSGFGGAGVSSYTNTDIGQVVTLAYIDAYTKLVYEMGGMPSAAEGGASAQSPMQTVSMTRAGRMYTTSSPNSKVVRSLSAGMLLYPTGNKDGAMWEVKDELGNQGWVSSMSFELAK